jgi:hypothetical protein
MENNKMDRNKIAIALALGLILAACGSDTSSEQSTEDITKDKVDKSTEVAKSEPVAKPTEVTKLVATPNMKVEKIEGQAMEIVKDKLAGWQQGKVQFLNLEGGFYGIITETGQKLLPMNLPAEYRQNGAVVRVKGKVKNVMTIQQWGTPFTISDIELISKGSGSGDNRS